jgi:hypothetical protein
MQTMPAAPLPQLRRLPTAASAAGREIPLSYRFQPLSVDVTINVTPKFRAADKLHLLTV